MKYLLVIAVPDRGTVLRLSPSIAKHDTPIKRISKARNKLMEITTQKAAR